MSINVKEIKTEYFLNMLRDFKIEKSDERCKSYICMERLETKNIFTGCVVLALSFIEYRNNKLTKEKIMSHFRVIAGKIHPDKHIDNKLAYQDAFIKLVEAKDYLITLLEECDQNKRKTKKKQTNKKKWQQKNFYKY